MNILNFLILIPFGFLKLINKISYKMRESDTIEAILTFSYTLIVLAIFYKAFWPFENLMVTVFVIAGAIMALSVGITLIIKSYYFVTTLFYDITMTPSKAFDDRIRKIKRRKENGMAAGAKAEVGLQYFINLEKNKQYSNVRFYR